MMEINIKQDTGKIQHPAKASQESTVHKKLPAPGLMDRVPLTVKILIISALVGILLWVILDHFQASRTKSIFMEQLNERLAQHAMEDRLRFDRYVKTFPQSVRLFVRQKNFTDYVENQIWHQEDTGGIKFHKRPPKWFPRLSVLRIFAQPRFALLLDSQGMVREVYSSHQDGPPTSLLNPTSLLTAKSRRQSYLTKIDNISYLVTSDVIRDNRNQLKAMLMLASPIDDGFLIASLNKLDQGHEVALLTSGQDPLIMTSTNLQKLPAGTTLSSLKDRYLVTGQEFFDYGASSIVIKLASFISTAEVKSLTGSVISRERQRHAISGSVFILSFAVIMLWIVRRIQKLTGRISRFSSQVLGAKQEELPKGDQLYMLDERFRRLTEEVLESREIIRRQAEEQTSLIVKNAFDAIITTDATARIITWNPRAEAVFGWKKEEVAGKRIFEILVPEQYRQRHLTGIKRFLATGCSPVFNIQFEATCLHRTGHEFPVELAVSPVQSGDNYMFIAIIRDITERKKAEEKILEKEKELRLITESSIDTTLIVSKSGTIRYISPSVKENFGYTADEITGTSFVTYIPGKELSKGKKALTGIFTKKQIKDFETVIKHSEGSLIPVEFSAQLIKMEGEYVVQGTLRDIAERKKAEEKIKGLLDTVTNSNTEWEMTFDNVKALIVLVDRNLKIIRYNRGFARFANQPAGEIIGSQCQEFLPCDTEWFAIEDNGHPKEQIVKTEVQTKSGLWLYVSHVPVYDNASFLYTIIIATDITELKKTQQHLIESREEIKDKVEDLEKLYELAVNRELKMIELKKEIKRLKSEHNIDDPVEV